jgi:hypothetical protein
LSQSAKDAYWKPSFKALCDAYYQELLSSALVKRWQDIDVVTGFLVALTASGSTIAGLTLWSKPEFVGIWGTIAVVAAIASICRSVLDVTSRVKQQTDLHHTFLKLRVQIENFRTELGIDMSLDDAKKEFEAVLNDYRDSMARTDPDIAATSGLQRNVQKQVTDSLKSEGLIL